MPRVTCLKPPVKVIALRSASTLTTEAQRLGARPWRRLRIMIFVRARGLCECEECRRLNRLRAASEVDHIVPLWQGGSDDPVNLQAISVECHRAKSEREAGQRAKG